MGAKMADGSRKGSNSKFKGTPINFFDPSSRAMRKGCDGEWGEKKEKNGENSSPQTLLPFNRLTGNQLQCRLKPITSLKITPLDMSLLRITSFENTWHSSARVFFSSIPNSFGNLSKLLLFFTSTLGYLFG